MYTHTTSNDTVLYMNAFELTLDICLYINVVVYT